MTQKKISSNKNEWLAGRHDMPTEAQRLLPAIPSLEVGESAINNAAAIEALCTRGLLWLAENKAGYGNRIGRARRPNAIQPFKVTGLDDLLPEGGFLPGTAHELFVESGLREAPSAIVSAIGAIVHRSRLKETSSTSKLAAWIGKSAWPTPHFLDHIFHAPAHSIPPQITALSERKPASTVSGSLSRCLFLDPPNQKATFWTIDTALRSPAVGVVIASLPKISFALSRRFLLASRTGDTIGLFYRPIRQGGRPQDTATAFTTRWLIRPEVSTTSHPRWIIELLKYKGSAPRKTTWSVELCGSDDDQNVPLHLSPSVADRRSTSSTSGESARDRRRA
jgi:hypothetical protein